MADFKSLLAVLAMALALGACKPGAAITCPTLKSYSKAFLAKAGDELDMIEAKAPNIVQLLNDYSVERDAIRRCIKLRAKARK